MFQFQPWSLPIKKPQSLLKVLSWECSFFHSHLVVYLEEVYMNYVHWEMIHGLQVLLKTLKKPYRAI